MKPQRTIHEPLRELPSERTRRIVINVTSGDGVLISRCLSLIADRCERTSSRLKDLCPELRARAGRLRAIAAKVDAANGEEQQ